MLWRDARKLDWTLTPLEALARWPAERPVMLLHSGRFDPRWARWSILAEPVGVYQFIGTPHGLHHSRWEGPADLPMGRTPLVHHPFRDLRALLGASGSGAGLWLGYFAYDLARWIERLPNLAAEDRHWPLIELAWCPGYLVHDGETGAWHACDAWTSPGWYDDLPGRTAPAPAAFTATNPQSVLSPEAYQQAVARVIDYIAAGDVFQVNMAQRFTADLTGAQPLASRALYRRLAAVSPAWYGAYLEFGDAAGPQRILASTSPELFLEVRDREVITRPIKGTRPASVPAEVLLHSEKDRAELNMIVDLLRNDLGRVCSYGSVKVPEPRVIESHPTVHHGVSTITGRLHRDKDLVDLLRATMPGGSITGAPKVRAMEIIDELEPVRRGPYCGAIGMVRHDFACLNIAIRTMLIDPRVGRVDFSVGGGIVADSEPQAEYQETLDKAAAILRALRGAG